jgi:hypothetical protein
MKLGLIVRLAGLAIGFAPGVSVARDEPPVAHARIEVAAGIANGYEYQPDLRLPEIGVSLRYGFGQTGSCPPECSRAADPGPGSAWGRRA